MILNSFFLFIFFINNNYQYFQTVNKDHDNAVGGIYRSELAGRYDLLPQISWLSYSRLIWRLWYCVNIQRLLWHVYVCRDKPHSRILIIRKHFSTFERGQPIIFDVIGSKKLVNFLDFIYKFQHLITWHCLIIKLIVCLILICMFEISYQEWRVFRCLIVNNNSNTDLSKIIFQTCGRTLL